jgi:hypothetical protein
MGSYGRSDIEELFDKVKELADMNRDLKRRLQALEAGREPSYDPDLDYEDEPSRPEPSLEYPTDAGTSDRRDAVRRGYERYRMETESGETFGSRIARFAYDTNVTGTDALDLANQAISRFRRRSRD